MLEKNSRTHVLYYTNVVAKESERTENGEVKDSTIQMGAIYTGPVVA